MVAMGLRVHLLQLSLYRVSKSFVDLLSAGATGGYANLSCCCKTADESCGDVETTRGLQI